MEGILGAIYSWWQGGGCLCARYQNLWQIYTLLMWRAAVCSRPPFDSTAGNNSHFPACGITQSCSYWAILGKWSWISKAIGDSFGEPQVVSLWGPDMSGLILGLCLLQPPVWRGNRGLVWLGPEALKDRDPKGQILPKPPKLCMFWVLSVVWKVW